MKNLTSLILSLVFVYCSAQKNSAVAEQLTSHLLPQVQKHFIAEGNSQSRNFSGVDNLIKTLSHEAGYPEQYHLKLVHTRQGQASTHYFFDIYLNKMQLFGAFAMVTLDAQNEIRLIQASQLPADPELEASPVLTSAEVIKNQLGAKEVVHTESVWVLASQNQLKQALMLELKGPETLHREVLYANGEILYNNDLLKYFAHSHAGPNDTVVDVRVFDPDPLTSAQVAYGDKYTDHNDQNIGTLNVQRQQRSTIFSYKNSQFHPENDFVKIAEFSAPATTRPVSSSPQFNYTRDQSEFEDVNVVYHITRHAQHLDQMGYAGLPGYQIEVDAHAISNADQSFFSTSTFPHRLYFGEGGVDDAEDADVVIHEYSHAVVFAAAPSGAKDTERKCIEEAICDYFAVSYSRSISSFNSNTVFNWDGNNEFWPGRNVTSNLSYQQANFKNGNYYAHTDMMAGVLLEVFDQLGRAKADQLLLESLYQLTPSSTMADMAHYMLLSDSLINNAANVRAISDAFYQSGMFPQVISEKEVSSPASNIKLLNTYGFARGENLLVESPQKLSDYQIFDVKGRTVKSGVFNGEKNTEINAGELKPGVYVLKVNTIQGLSASFKLVKFSY